MGAHDIIVVPVNLNLGAGSAQYSVIVTNPETGEPVPDARVVLVADNDNESNPGWAIATNSPADPSQYDVNLKLDSTGSWAIRADVSSSLGADLVDVANLDVPSVNRLTQGTWVFVGVSPRSSAESHTYGGAARRDYRRKQAARAETPVSGAAAPGPQQSGGRLLLISLAMLFALPLALWAAPSAFAHGGIDAGQEPWTAWNTNPLPTVLVLLAAYVYINGLSNWDRPTHRVNSWQRASFFFRAVPGLLRIAVSAGPDFRPPAFLPPDAALHPPDGGAHVHPAGRSTDADAAGHASLGAAGNHTADGQEPLRSTGLRAAYQPYLHDLLLPGQPLPCGSSREPSTSPCATMRCMP